MTNEKFERRLHEEESSTLDFKKSQYPFSGATENEKSELLKDILGFANAGYGSQAYILIGVEDVRGGRGNVVGISKSEHLDDHVLQQFVHHRTNRPLDFRYEAFEFEGKQVGILTIDQHGRPFYLNKDYGKLKKGEVYVRRGSSTDLNKPASIDEIAQMGADLGQTPAELVVEFACVDSDEMLGTKIKLQAEFCTMPPLQSIPDLSPPQQRHPSGFDLSALQFDLMNRLNQDFYRELADFEFARRLFRPIRLVLKNVGEVAAKNVRSEFRISRDADAQLFDPSVMPPPPKTRRDLIFAPALVENLQFSRGNRGEIHIEKGNNRHRIEIDWPDLQPGRRVLSEAFYIAKGSTGEITLKGYVYADNLPQPKDFVLTISFSVTETSMSIDDLRSISEPTHPDD